MATEINPYALCGLDDAKEYGNLRSPDDDRMLVELINQTSARIERFCGRNFISRSYKHTDESGELPRLTTRGGTIYRFANPPVTAITGLKLHADATELTVASDNSGNAVLDQTTGTLRLLGGMWFYGTPDAPTYEVMEVTYTGGYKVGLDDTADESWIWGYDQASSDIRWAAIKETVWQYSKRTLEREGLASRSEPGVSVTYVVDAWHPDVREVLERYQRVPVPC